MSQTRYGKSALALAVAAVVSTSSPLAGANVLEEVEVTARKRTESLQDVPMAVSAFTAEQLTNFQVDSITDLERLTPNITVTDTSGLVAGAVQIFMRGIGNDPGFSQGVGIYIDDVYLNRTSGSLLEVYDVERIEVLKGPQGNLYGRNTIGGAIKYVSRQPGDELMTDIEIKGGEYNLRQIKGNISGPLIANTLYGGFGMLVRQRDGYQTNTYDGSEWASQDNQAYRANLLWTPTDTFRTKLWLDYAKDESDPYIPMRVAIDPAFVADSTATNTQGNLLPTPAGLSTEPSDGSLPTDIDRPSSEFVDGYNQYEIETVTAAITLEWDFSDRWTAKSVTAQRNMDNVLPYDYDGSNQHWITTLYGRGQEDFSQEFQFNYSGDSLSAVMGLYYLNGQRDAGDIGNYTEQTSRLRLVQYHNKHTYRDDRDIESYAAYLNLDWNITDSIQWSLGGRYTRETKTLEQRANVELGQYGLAIAPGLATSSIGPIFALAPGLEAANLGAADIVGYSGSVDGVSVPFSPTPLPLDVTRFEEPISNEETWDNFSPSTRLAWFANDTTMLYGGIATGFKSGGLQSNGNVATNFDPETVIAYTLGLKTDLLDSSLRFNFEAFYNDYQDKQLATISLQPNGNLDEFTDNVGKVSTSGAELEMTWLPAVDGLMFGLNVGYLDSEVKEYLSDTATGVVDNADTTALGFAPLWSVQGRVMYDINLGSMGWLTLGADGSYRTESFTNSPIDLTSELETQQVQDENVIWNAMIAWRSAQERWRVALEGKNLDDTRVLTNTFQVGPIITGGYNMPRTWALSAAYRY